MRVLSRLCTCLPWCKPSSLSPRTTVATLSTGSGDAEPLERAAALLSSGAKVVVMTGAGVSVSAGIPDFRTPGSGLYDNLQEYNLPYAEAIFDLDFFQNTPQPFYRLCKELWPGNYSATPTHRFIKLLHDKGQLVRCFTQNIDSLETAAGLPKEAVVAAHGNFDGAHVAFGKGAGTEVPVDELKEAMLFDGEEKWRALNAKYGGLVKPDIVFFGEQLPARFFQCAMTDFPKADLLIVMGTSLVVQPFAGLVNNAPPAATRLLVNRERVGEDSFGFGGRGFDFDAEGSRDLFHQGDCDGFVTDLVDRLGWRSEFERI